MIDKKNTLSELLNSYKDGIVFEIGEDNGTSDILSGLNNAYDIALEKLDEEINENDVIRMSLHIRSVNPQTRTLYDPAQEYRKTQSKVTSLKKPPHSSQIPYLMNQLLFLSSNYSEIDPIQRSAFCYGGIFTIQPFDDGNKRLGRVLGDKILIENGLNLPRFKSRDDYIDTLESVYSSLREDIKNKNGIENRDHYLPLVDRIQKINL